MHDSLRVLRNGEKTFQRIWTNLVNAHKTEFNFKIVLRLHVNMYNKESMKQLLYKISRNLASDNRFPVFIRGLGKFGGKNDGLLPVVEGEELVNTIKDLKDLASGLNIGLVDGSIISGAQCYASKFNSLIIRSDGKIGKCTVALYDRRNIIGEINSDGTMNFEKDKFSWWVRGNFTGNEQQLHCPLYAPGSMRD